MNNASVKSLAALLARAPEWACKYNGKVFDNKQTFVLRTYRHNGTGVYAAFGQNSPGKGAEIAGIEVNAKLNRAVHVLGDACDLPDSLVSKAAGAK